MSKVPYTINVNDYVCAELDRIRKMKETLDFSMLMACVERIQIHASMMENALYRYEGIKYTLSKKVDDDEMTDAEFRAKAKEILEELKK